MVCVETPLERHTLVWLSTPGWRALRDAAPPDQQGALGTWHRHDWPVVVRRAEARAAVKDIDVGLPMPPDPATGAKARIALSVVREHVARVAPPMALGAALAAAVPASAPQRAALAALIASAGPADLRAYGSLAMQALTGLPYLRPSSDIDLLFRPACRRQLDQVSDLLAHHAQALPLDGEIVFPGGQAVAWKEWRMACTPSNGGASAASGIRVMVKSLHRVYLARPDQLLEELPT
jgi:phosphoribosyl-dephospho-CoA transferase